MVSAPPVNFTSSLVDRRDSSGDSAAARMDAGALASTSTLLAADRLSM